jgi:4-amino-4-deoxy-L-arabinose transferase-like glycosyltransferase
MADINEKQLRLPGFFHPVLLLFLALLAQASLRLWLQQTNSVPFNSDEAVVALMARHILAGASVPIFFYGQSYMGSLDAILLAVGFAIFGQQVWVIRFLQFLLYALLMVTTFILARKITDSLAIARLSILLMMVPTVNVQLYTTVTLGGYSEALVIGNLILILAYQMRHNIGMGIHSIGLIG